MQFYFKLLNEIYHVCSFNGYFARLRNRTLSNSRCLYLASDCCSVDITDLVWCSFVIAAVHFEYEHSLQTLALGININIKPLYQFLLNEIIRSRYIFLRIHLELIAKYRQNLNSKSEVMLPDLFEKSLHFQSFLNEYTALSTSIYLHDI